MSESKKFLVAEDSLAMRRVIINTLRRIFECEFFEAEDGLQAVDIFKTESIDFILMDWLMPNLDGLQAAHHIREIPGGNDVPIIMITTKETKSDILKAITSGIDDYIVKPVYPVILESKIRKIEAKRSQES